MNFSSLLLASSATLLASQMAACDSMPPPVLCDKLQAAYEGDHCYAAELSRIIPDAKPVHYCTHFFEKQTANIFGLLYKGTSLFNDNLGFNVESFKAKLEAEYVEFVRKINHLYPVYATRVMGRKTQVMAFWIEIFNQEQAQSEALVATLLKANEGQQPRSSSEYLQLRFEDWQKNITDRLEAVRELVPLKQEVQAVKRVIDNFHHIMTEAVISTNQYDLNEVVIDRIIKEFLNALMTQAYASNSYSANLKVAQRVFPPVIRSILMKMKIEI